MSRNKYIIKSTIRLINVYTYVETREERIIVRYRLTMHLTRALIMTMIA